MPLATVYCAVSALTVSVFAGVPLAVPEQERLGLAYRRLLGLGCLGLPVLRLALGGMDWAEAVLMRQHDVLTVDILFIIAGAWLWLHGRGWGPVRQRIPEAAE